MRSFLLDSNALADCMFKRKGVDQRVDEARRRGDRLGTAIPAAAELLGGIEASMTRDTNLPVAKRNLKLFRLWPFDLPAALEYARLYAELRRLGVAIQTIDLMIAAVAKLIPNCTVVTTDSDLSRVPGLRVENWTS